MPRFRFENRVKESSNDTGTGDFSLGGAQKTYRSFGAECDDQDTFTYAIVHDAADEHEIGVGKYDQPTNSIVRQKVLESSNNDVLVDFGSGAKVVAMVLPKERTPALDATPSAGDVPVSDGDEHQPSSNAPDKIVAGSGLDTRGDMVDGQGRTLYSKAEGGLNAGELNLGEVPSGRRAAVPLSREYHGTVTDGAAVYGLYSNGSDLALYKSTSPENDNWTEVNRWDGITPPSNNLRSLHISSQGTILIGVDGTLKRSVDGGDTFSDVRALNNIEIWSWSEASNGDIIYVERNGDAVYQSTDDGQTWSELANRSTTFTNYPTHLHKAAYHPVNDNILVCGGDGGSQSKVYVSDDGGASWSSIDVTAQVTGIVGDPSDGSRWLLGEDDTSPTYVGVRELILSGTSKSSARLLVNTNQDLEQTTTEGSAHGSFSLTIINRSDVKGVVTSTLNNTHDFVAVTSGLSAQSWRFVSPISEKLIHTKSSGAHPGVLTDNNATVLVGSDRAIRLSAVRDPSYGAPANDRVEDVPPQDDVHMGYEALRFGTRTSPSNGVIRAFTSGDTVVDSTGDTLFLRGQEVRLDDSNPLTVDNVVESRRGVRSESTNVSDDTAISLNPLAAVVKIFVSTNSGDVGEAVLDVNGGSIIENRFTTANVNITTGSLSGTTGTDGSLTISADSTNNSIDIENRLGGQRTIQAHIKG